MSGRREIWSRPEIDRVRALLKKHAEINKFTIKFEYRPYEGHSMFDDCTEYIDVFVPPEYVRHFKRILRWKENRRLVHDCNDQYDVYWRVVPVLSSPSSSS